MRKFHPLILVAFFAECAGDGRGSPELVVLDVPGLEIHLLPDARVLEPGAPDFSPRGPTLDANLPEEQGRESYPAEAGGLSDEGFARDSASPLDLLDVASPGDTGFPDDGGRPITGLCGPDGSTCPPGSSCLPDDETGIPTCRFVADCSDHGAVEVEELLEFAFTSSSIYVKVKARVRVGPAVCTMIPCPADSPCCNACFAPLAIGNEKFPILLLGQGVAFGCQGSECDYALSCSPLKPGESYFIWGTLSLIGGEVQFFVDSYCPAPGSPDPRMRERWSGSGRGSPRA